MSEPVTLATDAAVAGIEEMTAGCALDAFPVDQMFEIAPACSRSACPRYAPRLVPWHCPVFKWSSTSCTDSHGNCQGFVFAFTCRSFFILVSFISQKAVLAMFLYHSCGQISRNRFVQSRHWRITACTASARQVIYFQMSRHALLNDLFCVLARHE